MYHTLISIAGSGLLSPEQTPTGVDILVLLARLLLDLAGLGFLLLAALFVALNAYGAVRVRCGARARETPPAVAPGTTHDLTA
ncbi:hypothetical protein [Actinomyces sp. MRS3W]|uniref:hypothetical protein n=1 Tax=Actinomyces sp. MRS3W TaxID=2800796 RepID=UPI0028FD7DC8|nr:hypothetical protein [Actinomyces sp. MRS3W]MDU0348528.1 hypothetical protein [Actinomyces sp. MRS3W]